MNEQEFQTAAQAVATMYSKPGCYQCKASARAFAKDDLPLNVVDVSADPAAAELIDGLGHRSVPVIIITATGEHWSGHRPDRIAAVTDQAKVA
ncbi:MAG: NrdH-redoxin [Actinomycetia bacterium]|nr:NrdH-redoxin [Actinomycetes bacterium]